MRTGPARRVTTSSPSRRRPPPVAQRPRRPRRREGPQHNESLPRPPSSRSPSAPRRRPAAAARAPVIMPSSNGGGVARKKVAAAAAPGGRKRPARPRERCLPRTTAAAPCSHGWPRWGQRGPGPGLPRAARAAWRRGGLHRAPGFPDQPHAPAGERPVLPNARLRRCSARWGQPMRRSISSARVTAGVGQIRCSRPGSARAGHHRSPGQRLHCRAPPFMGREAERVTTARKWSPEPRRSAPAYPLGQRPAPGGLRWNSPPSRSRPGRPVDQVVRTGPLLGRGLAVPVHAR